MVLQTFLAYSPGATLIDVRSPSEYAQGHIPGAMNMPLLSDRERAEVGTLYKQVSPDRAYCVALSFVEPKLESFLTQAAGFCEPLTLYCWRGGMRSQSLHQLFKDCGLSSSTLCGGYKAYRRQVLAFLQTVFPLRVLTGLTGCGKTERLRKLQENGEQILDLEKLANHKGSVFGSQGSQPTNEQFENTLAAVLSSFSLKKPIWVEDESRLIGSCKIPDALYHQMRQAPTVTVACSQEERYARLLREYGHLSEQELIAAIKRLQKRLGLERARAAIEAVENQDPHRALTLILSYYDRSYRFKRRQPT